MKASSGQGTKVVVIGASGFVGRTLCQALDSTNEFHAVPLSRSTGGPDINSTSREQWEEILAGTCSCVHLASRLPWGGDNHHKSALPDFLKVNTDGAVRVFRAFEQAGGRHFVFLSSIGVNGTVSGKRPFRENDKPKPVGNYAISKRQAEVELLMAAHESSVKLTILRPPIIYGRGVGGSFAALVEQILLGRYLPLGGVHNQRDMIGVRNLVDLILVVLREEVSGTFLVRDRDTISSQALVEKIAKAYGVSPKLFNVPQVVQKTACALPGIGAIAKRLFSDVKIDDAAIAAHCSWQPRFTVDQEIAMIPKKHTSDVK